MKRATTPCIRVKTVIPNSDISTIEFLFKQESKESAPNKLLKTYPTNVTYNPVSQIYTISMTEAETRLFAEDTYFYMDTKITLTNGRIPETKIVAFKMNKTLFAATAEEEEEDDS